MATEKEIQELKKQWRQDPIWDLHETDGYEDHAEELKSYQEEWEAIWESRRIERLEAKAKKMGIPDNLDLAKYIDNLEFALERLRGEVDEIKTCT